MTSPGGWQSLLVNMLVTMPIAANHSGRDVHGGKLCVWLSFFVNDER